MPYQFLFRASENPRLQIFDREAQTESTGDEKEAAKRRKRESRPKGHGYLSKFKIPFILAGLAFMSFLLTNYNREPYFQEFFIIDRSLFEDKAKIKQERADKIYSILNSNLQSPDGTYAVFIKDLKSDETFAIAAGDKFTAASIYKLAVMYKAFDALEAGQLSKSDLLTANVPLANNQATDTSSNNTNNQQNTSVSYTVNEALRLMITISDNDAALLLASKLGWQNIENFLKGQGIDGFILVSNDLPKTTAASTAQILEKIYRGRAVSKQASNEMEKLLLNQQVTDRIPKYLPQNVKVAHKTGELSTVRNDAGIVFGKKSDYIFVFFTNTPNPDAASETIAQTSRDIFNTLEQP